MNFVRTLTLRQLQIFAVAARHLSYARAAEELHLSPPAVSMQLKQLEDNVGLPLFERMGRGVGKLQNWKKAIVTLKDGDSIADVARADVDEDLDVDEVAAV